MATTQEYALLSLYVYNVENDAENRPNTPQGWTLLENKDDNLLGFSYGVFRNTASGEVVLAYTGTNEGVDWLSNGLAGTGILPSPQIAAAAKAYVDAKAAYGPNITLSGHSLGGGLASVMAVWFNRPAVVFDEGPFEATALNPLIMAAVAASLGLTGTAVPAEFLSFIATYPVVYGQREAQVANHYLQGEALAALRAAWPTVMGSDTPISVNGASATAVQLHSMALLTAARLSEDFRLATYASNSIVPLIMHQQLYGTNTGTSTERNFLIDLIRSEQQTPDNSKLDHFANDLFKIGGNIAGLNAAAQHAIIAQGIEWYYWQSNNYAGKEFLAQTGSLLQYTTARGDGLEGAQNKAGIYTAGWLASLQNDNGAAYSPILRVDYEQWNISAGNSGVTATAKDAAKSQVFIGGGGADSFTGGDKADTLLGGIGNDELNGGAGNDVLFGGAGTDTYSFKDAFGKDTITDSDGQGTIQIDGQTIGTAQGAGKRNVWVAEVGAGQYVGMSVYDDQSSATGKKLVITRADSTDNTITINNFDLDKAQGSEGYLGIKLDPTQRLALVQGTGSDVGASTSNVWADNTFKASSLEGQSSDVVEANGKSFNIYLAHAAHAGAQSERRVSLNTADSSYRIRSCLRMLSRGCTPIRHIKCRALRVSNASVCRVIMTCGMCA